MNRAAWCRAAAWIGIVAVALTACSGRSARPVSGPSADLRASFRGRLDLQGESTKLRGILAITGQGKIRIEIRGPVGGTRALLVANGEEIIVLLPSGREFIKEPGTPATVEALLGISISTRELAGLIRSAHPAQCGRVPEPEGLAIECLAQGVRAVFEGGALELRLKDPIPVEQPGLPASLFETEIPEGWNRVRLDDASRLLVR